MILNKTKSHRDRYRILDGNMGNHGDPKDWPTHKYHIANGIDRGGGYQGSMSVTYFFSEEARYVPEEARKNAIRFLLANGYEKWLKERGIL
jgi:hypothetical protein